MAEKKTVKYSKKLCDKVLLMIENMMTITEICKLEGMPNRRTIHRWRHKYPEFNKDFMMSEDIRLTALMDECIGYIKTSSYDRLVDKLGFEPTKFMLSSEEARVKEFHSTTKFFSAKLYGTKPERDRISKEVKHVVVKTYGPETPPQRTIDNKPDLQPEFLKNYDSFTEAQKAQCTFFKNNK